MLLLAIEIIRAEFDKILVFGGCRDRAGSLAASPNIHIHTRCVAGGGAVIDIELDTTGTGEPCIKIRERLALHTARTFINNIS